MVLDKNSILNVLDLKRETVPCPEWGGDVIVQEISALDRDRLLIDLTGPDGEIDSVNMTCKVLVRCMVDETGSRIFCDEEAEALGKKSTTVLKRIFNVAQKLNSILPEQDATKNSEADLSESSPSNSL